MTGFFSFLGGRHSICSAWTISHTSSASDLKLEFGFITRLKINPVCLTARGFWALMDRSLIFIVNVMFSMNDNEKVSNFYVKTSHGQKRTYH